mmetsp:Transcript_20336/g.42398  ORF Transcript_20336/g.42398 Transcript_20336/m.42398 type:complete len:237 (-) Transcript_20336:746-1456(-)
MRTVTNLPSFLRPSARSNRSIQSIDRSINHRSLGPIRHRSRIRFLRSCSRSGTSLPSAPSKARVLLDPAADDDSFRRFRSAPRKPRSSPQCAAPAREPRGFCERAAPGPRARPERPRCHRIPAATRFSDAALAFVPRERLPSLPLRSGFGAGAIGARRRMPLPGCIPSTPPAAFRPAGEPCPARPWFSGRRSLFCDRCRWSFRPVSRPEHRRRPVCRTLSLPRHHRRQKKLPPPRR